MHSLNERQGGPYFRLSMRQKGHRKMWLSPLDSFNMMARTPSFAALSFIFIRFVFFFHFAFFSIFFVVLWMCASFCLSFCPAADQIGIICLPGSTQKGRQQFQTTVAWWLCWHDIGQAGREQQKQWAEVGNSISIVIYVRVRLRLNVCDYINPIFDVN